MHGSIREPHAAADAAAMPVTFWPGRAVAGEDGW